MVGFGSTKDQGELNRKVSFPQVLEEVCDLTLSGGVQGRVQAEGELAFSGVLGWGALEFPD